MKKIMSNFEPIYLVGNVNELKRDNGKLNLKFRLVGVPPNQTFQLVDTNLYSSIADLKKTLIRSYKLNPIIAIQFIYKGKVLLGNLKCSMFGGVHTKRDVITVMGIIGGG